MFVLSDFGNGVSWFLTVSSALEVLEVCLIWDSGFSSLCTVQKVVQSPWCVHSLMPACNCPVFILLGAGEQGHWEVQFLR